MPVPENQTLRHLSGDEWILFKKLHELHATDFPAYPTTFWNRPTSDAGRAVWDLLAKPMGVELKDLREPLPRSWEPNLVDVWKDTTTTMQAFALLLAVAVDLGETHRLLTMNRFLEALVRGWSDHWRSAVEDGRATSVFHLTEPTWRACRRDLVRWRLDLSKLWGLLSVRSGPSGDNPLFRLERIGREEEESSTGLGGAYRVILRNGVRETKDWKKFIQYIRTDRLKPAPHYENQFKRLPILRASDRVKRHSKPSAEIIAERRFNVVTVGGRSQQALDALERATVLLDVSAFQQDYLQATTVVADARRALSDMGLRASGVSKHRRWFKGRLVRSFRELELSKLSELDRDKARELLAHYDDAEWIVTSFKSAHDQVEAARATSFSKLVELAPLFAPPMRNYWNVRSGFRKVSNRRFQPDNFHLSAITSDPWDSTLSRGLLGAIQDVLPDAAAGLRFRWFKAPALPGSAAEAQELVGFDVRASQIQIIALLAGLHELEESFRGGGDFRKQLAQVALPYMRPGYEGPTDPRLVAAMKNMVMTKFYGRKVHKVVEAHEEEKEKFGPGWFQNINAQWAAICQEAQADIQKGTNASVALRRATKTLGSRYAAQNIDLVLDSMPDREGVEKFLLACRRLALRAHRKEEGATLTDPLDANDPRGGGFTWDPIAYETESKGFSSGGIGPTVGTPKEGESGRAASRAELQNLLSPCLVHCLDSYFLSLVILELQRRGVQHFATVHDCVYVPERLPTEGSGSAGGLAVLAEAMNAAAWEWFQGLDATLKDLERYLESDKARIPKPNGWRLTWKEETYSDFVKELRARWQARRDAAEQDPAFRPRFAVSHSRKDKREEPNGPFVEEAV